MPASGRSAAASGQARRLADFLDTEQRKFCDRAALRMRIPFGERAARRDDETGLGGRGFERLGLPAVERALHRGFIVLAAEQLSSPSQ